VLLLLVVRTVVVIDFIAGVVLRTVLLSDLLFLLLLLFSIMATALAVLIVVSRVEFLGRSNKHQVCGRKWNFLQEPRAELSLRRTTQSWSFIYPLEALWS
jgi:hypothetical protein